MLFTQNHCEVGASNAGFRQSGNFSQEVLIVSAVDVQVSAVSAQTGVQASSDTGAQVAADVGSTNQQDGGLEFLNGVNDNLGVSVGGVDIQQIAFISDDLVCAIAAQDLCLFSNALAAQSQTDNFFTQFVSQDASTRDQFFVGRHNFATALFTEYPYALESGDVFEIIFSH